MTQFLSQFTHAAGLGSPARPKGFGRDLFDSTGPGGASAPAVAKGAAPFAAHLDRLTARDFGGATGPAAAPKPLRPLGDDASAYVPGAGHAAHGASGPGAPHALAKLQKSDFEPARASHAGQGTEHERLTRQAEKWVSQTFFGAMLKQMHESPFKSNLLDGGHGGQAFSPLYDQHLADRMSRGAGGKLVRSLVKQIEGRRAYGPQALKAAAAVKNAPK